MVTCLHSRYEDLRIYTYIGNVLVAVNPFQTVDIYNEQVASAFIGVNVNNEQWLKVVLSALIVTIFA